MMIQPIQLYGFVVVAGLLMAINPCNPWLTNDLRAYNALYNCKETFTDVMKTLQIKLFMQNKANFQKVKLNVNNVLTKDYDQMDTWSIRKTKPIQSQSKPIQTQLKPIKSQNKPNSCPPSTWWWIRAKNAFWVIFVAFGGISGIIIET